MFADVTPFNCGGPMAKPIPLADLAGLSPAQKMELADILYELAQQELDAAELTLAEQHHGFDGTPPESMAANR
jgi:hypothetical protein